MTPISRRWTVLLALAAALAACGRTGEPLAEETVAAGTVDTSIHYTREYVFLGRMGGAPLAAPFSFLTTDRGGGELERVQRAWLAHGGTWDPFVDAQWTASRAPGVWRILPHGDLRVAAGGSMELEAIWFQQRERSLRLDLGGVASSWQQSRDVRVRLLEGRLQLGGERIPGTVLELLRVDRPRDTAAVARDYDSLFLLAGDTLRLYISEALSRDDGVGGQSFAWSVGRDGERTWEQSQLRWLEVRQYDPARREIPLRWSFRVPEGNIQGEVRAMGFDVVVGAERAGRRSVEARYTVEGWVEVEGRRSEVIGVVRHSQD